MEKQKKGHGCLVAFIIIVILIIAIGFGGYKLVMSVFDGGLLINGTWDCDGETVTFNKDGNTYNYDGISGTYSFDNELVSTGARYNLTLKYNDTNKKITVDVIEKDSDISLKITDNGVTKTCKANK